MSIFDRILNKTHVIDFLESTERGSCQEKKLSNTIFLYFSSDIDKGFYCNHNFSYRVLRVFSDRVFRISRQTGTKQSDKYINIFNKLVYLTSRKSNKSCEIVILAHIFDYHPYASSVHRTRSL